jgi:peptidoglycan/xylan/chitin deacetylase (PgdA/CDA1 family)
MTIPTLRWAAKKAARRATVMGSLASGALLTRKVVGPTRMRAITYHRFGESRHDPYCVSVQTFEAQMRWLAEQRLAVSLDQVLRFVRGETDVADDSVLVTIDDGFRSVLTIAAPILKRYAIPAVAYITTSAVENEPAGKAAGEAFLEWPEVSALHASGLTIGSHGNTHRSMAKLDIAEVREEGRVSKGLLERQLGVAVTSFAYPYGMRTDESPATMEALAGCGYDSIFIAQHGALRAGSDSRRLRRIKVEGGEPLWMFRLLCRGGMDAWGLADRVL